MFSRRVITFALFLIILTFGSCKTLGQGEDNKQNKSRNTPKPPDDGYIRLVLNEKTGSFSLYCLSDTKTIRYEPLFNADEPIASFLSINIDGKVYRLGNTRQFKTRIERLNGDPALVFESQFIRVTQLFTPIKTTASENTNGIMITIKVQNISPVKSAIGVRMLLDTTLGEGRKKVPFLTNTQVITSETFLENRSGELFWISRGNKVSLMGSIVNPEDGLGKGPELVHIANWKRLNDAPWKLAPLQGRSFNNLPYSVGDSAVCYYFGPEILDRDKTLTYTVFLTTEDLAWYKLTTVPSHIADKKTTEDASKPNETQQSEQIILLVSPEYNIYTVESTINIPAIEAQAQNEASAKNESSDTITLIKLQEILNLFIEGQIYLSEQDLTEIEQAIDRHKIRN
ncbi:hypothetical protein [Treponema sp. R80B11-R83G3]